MTECPSRRSPAVRPRILKVPGSGLAVALLIAACNAATPPTPVAEMTPSAATQPSAGGSEAVTNGPPAGQTDTDWGRIWDELPESFPVFPGATLADETSGDPTSGTFVLEGEEPRAVATWMQTELERGAYRTEALNGPFEDQGFVLALTGEDDCRIEVSIGPLGGLVAVNVRYGADCPAP